MRRPTSSLSNTGLKAPKSIVMMDQHQVRWALLKISLVALMGSSWIFTSFVFGSRPVDNAELIESDDALVSLVRMPASLPGQLPANLLTAQTKPMEPIRMDVMKLPCWDLPEIAEQPISSRWVRLIGRPCQSGAMAESVEVSNLSNGYSGTVFSTQKHGMTTDFIPLEEGNNEIMVRIGRAEGVAYENHFVLVKAAAE